MIQLSQDSANRLLSLADFALAVANVTGNSAIKLQAVQAIAELFEKAEETRKAAAASDEATD